MNFSSFSLKVLTASLIIASTTSVAFAKNYKGENYKGEAMAAPCPAPVMLKDGVYLGAQVGYDSYRVRNNIGTTVAGSTITGNPTLNATGWAGGLFLGYGRYLTDWFYLAGEIFGNVSNAEVNYNVNSGTSGYSDKFTVNGSYGLAILPGVKLNDTSLGYVRLGYNWVNLKAEDTVTVAGVNTSGNKSNTSNGFNFGLGIETLVYDNWSVRTEYNHTYLNSFTNGTSGSNFDPSDNQFMLGLLYHFA